MRSYVRSTENGDWLAAIIIIIITPWPFHMLLFQPPLFWSADGSSPYSVLLGLLLQTRPWKEEELWQACTCPLWRGRWLPCLQVSCHPSRAWNFPPCDRPGKGRAEAATVLEWSQAPLCLEVFLIQDSERRRASPAHCQHTFAFGLPRFKHMQIRVNAEPAAFFR